MAEKRYKMIFKDSDTDKLITVYEDSINKGFRVAFRKFKTNKDRELKLISKEKFITENK